LLNPLHPAHQLAQSLDLNFRILNPVNIRDTWAEKTTPTAREKTSAVRTLSDSLTNSKA